MTEQRPPRVFISYSHDTVEHQERVLGLADRLRADGIDAEIDQYNTAPPESWPLWCERQIAAADVVLMVCTETYHRRVSGDEERGKGLGVVWEARIIRQLLYDTGAVSDKFVPVLFSDASPEQIPTPIKGWPRYIVDTKDGYEDLYRRLTGQPRLLRPALGTIRPLPTRRRQWPEGTMEAPSGKPAFPAEEATPVPDPKLTKWLVLVVAVVSAIVVLAMFQQMRSQVGEGVHYIRTIIDPDHPPRVPHSELTYLADKERDPLPQEIYEKLFNMFQVDTGIKTNVIHANPANKIEEIRRGDSDIVLFDIILLDRVTDVLSNIRPYTQGTTKLAFINDTAVQVSKDVGLLYYRIDLLGNRNAPQTWDDLEQSALNIYNSTKVNASDFIAFAWQGDDYEGLTCNALEWIVSNGGVQEDGQIKYGSEEFFNAINNARRWIKGGKISSGTVLRYGEEESLSAFLEGKAAFLRSWPYAYAKLKKKFRENLGVAPLPYAKYYHRNVGVLGGAALAVPQNSKNKIEALSLMQYLTSGPVQKWRVEKGNYVPAGGVGAPPEVNDVIKKIECYRPYVWGKRSYEIGLH